MQETLTYLKHLRKDRQIASVTPTSARCVQRICRPIDFENAKVIVEYGPATGVFTKYLLSKMNPDARLIALDTNEGFLEILGSQIGDPRLDAVHANAADVLKVAEDRGVSTVDYFISGIPFRFIPSDTRIGIVRDTNTLLSKSGRFLVYQFFPQPRRSDSIRGLLAELMDLRRAHLEFFNVPPLWVYEAAKKEIA